MKNYIFRVYIIIALSLLCSWLTKAQYLIPQRVIGSGSISVSDSAYNITGTLGQPVSGVSGNSSDYSYSGFWFVKKTVITGLEDKTNVPLSFELTQNFPNPFNPSTKIRYALPFSSNVKIEIYNILGEKIRELVNEQKNTGYYEVNFNTTGLASGVYFYIIEAKTLDGKNDFTDTKKMVLLK